MTESAQVVEILGSPIKLLGLVVLGVLMTAVSAAVAIPLFPDFEPDVRTRLICYFGVAFFALCTGVAAWRLVRTRGPVVTITPDGIRDIRVAPEFIPWSAVKRISTWESYGQKMMILAVDPALERRLTLGPIARWSRGANRALGADGLCITAQGLKIDYPTLLEISQDRFQARRAGGRPA